MRNLYSFACDSQRENLQCSCRKYTKGPLRLQGAICRRILTRQEPPAHARKIRTISLKPLVRRACFGRGPPLVGRCMKGVMGLNMATPHSHSRPPPCASPRPLPCSPFASLRAGPEGEGYATCTLIANLHALQLFALGTSILAVAPRDCVRDLLGSAASAAGYILSIEDKPLRSTQLIGDTLEEVPNAKRWSNHRKRGPERNFLD